MSSQLQYYFDDDILIVESSEKYNMFKWRLSVNDDQSSWFTEDDNVLQHLGYIVFPEWNPVATPWVPFKPTYARPL